MLDLVQNIFDFYYVYHYVFYVYHYVFYVNHYVLSMIRKIVKFFTIFIKVSCICYIACIMSVMTGSYVKTFLPKLYQTNMQKANEKK